MQLSGSGSKINGKQYYTGDNDPSEYYIVWSGSRWEIREDGNDGTEGTDYYLVAYSSSPTGTYTKHTPYNGSCTACAIYNKFIVTSGQCS